ncbi:MAG: ATP-binding domain-containing protein [Polyangiaceae bacterium]
MTIQQAKNQEFDRVVVLWPFEIQGDAERLRRLLYNAVTRAKKYAAVIVQDPKKVRLGAAPFE